MRTFETAECATEASGLGNWLDWGRGRAVTMVLRAVFGTEVSMVWEAVKLDSFSRIEERLSGGSRTTSGPRLEDGGLASS